MDPGVSHVLAKNDGKLTGASTEKHTGKIGCKSPSPPRRSPISSATVVPVDTAVGIPNVHIAKDGALASLDVVNINGRVGITLTTPTAPVATPGST